MAAPCGSPWWGGRWSSNPSTTWPKMAPFNAPSPPCCAVTGRRSAGWPHMTGVNGAHRNGDAPDPVPRARAGRRYDVLLERFGGGAGGCARDGNKRAGAAAMLVFLEVNGRG